jgi:hypothetical protein
LLGVSHKKCLVRKKRFLSVAFDVFGSSQKGTSPNFRLQKEGPEVTNLSDGSRIELLRLTTNS